MVEETRYPFAGARNPVVKFGVVDTGKEGSDVKWFDLTKVFGDDFYLAKFEWLFNNDNDTDSSKLVLQILNRRQNQLELLLLDYTTGDLTTLHIEKALDDKSWVNINSDFRSLPSKDANNFMNTMIHFGSYGHRNGTVTATCTSSNRLFTTGERRTRRVIRWLGGLPDQVNTSVRKSWGSIPIRNTYTTWERWPMDGSSGTSSVFCTAVVWIIQRRDPLANFSPLLFQDITSAFWM